MPIVHQSKPQDQISAQGPEFEGALLTIDQLSYSYPDGHQALHEITLQIPRGEKAAIVGPNGAGKSTLMLHLNGIIQGQGEICVDGLPVVKDNLPIIRGKVGLVFQNPDDQLFSPTVFEDVAFGPLHMGLPEEKIFIHVEEALNQVGMREYAERLSHHLSVGEKKRIAIATVLAMKPEILVLDEPSAGLDPRARRSLITLLQEMPITMLISTHDMGLVAELLPRMIIMDQGHIVADGPTDGLLADEDLLEQHGLERP
ncbi:MAG: ABC transporter ATP-binding protein [Chloroflexota bacterium]